MVDGDGEDDGVAGIALVALPVLTKQERLDHIDRADAVALRPAPNWTDASLVSGIAVDVGRNIDETADDLDDDLVVGSDGAVADY